MEEVPSPRHPPGEEEGGASGSEDGEGSMDAALDYIEMREALGLQMAKDRDNCNEGGGAANRGGGGIRGGGVAAVVMPEESDESDVEDPDYLRQMCSNFTGKIKEKNDIIGIYKKVMLNTHLNLVKREAAYQRKIRRLLLGNRISKCLGNGERRGVAGGGGAAGGVNVLFDNGENGKDALLIFPEEIWTMVLEYVTEVKDIRSCSRVCQVFERILDGTKQQWLFGKVVPLIFNKLRRKELLTCRLVCKKWCSAVDNFLEKYYTIIAPDKRNEADELEDDLELPSVALKSFHFEYNFSIPPPPAEEFDSSSDSDDESSVSSSQDSINRNHDRYRDKMKLHSRNPFLGRSVTIEEDPVDFDHVEGQGNNRTFVSEAKHFLKDFGRHIWHLTISCNMDIQTPADFYNVCLQSLIECTSLKSLCLGADLNWRIRRAVDATKVNRYPAPVDNPLESLQVDVDDPKIFMIQDRIIEKYSNQLKRVEVQVWNSDIYCNFQWSLLRELQVNKGNADELLQSLKQMKAPSLRKLAIRLDGKGPYLQTLLELTNQFPKLNILEIKFESRFGGMSEDELMSLPIGLTASANLITLALTSSVTDILSYNFLLYFPFLQRLLIRHGHWTSYNLLDATAPYFTHLQRASFRAIKKNEIVKIAKYIMQDGVDADLKLMYKSNVWGILPFLQEFELCNARYVPEKRRIFTREGYEYYHKVGATTST